MSNASGRSREMSSENASLNLAIKGPFVILARILAVVYVGQGGGWEQSLFGVDSRREMETGRVFVKILAIKWSRNR